MTNILARFTAMALVAGLLPAVIAAGDGHDSEIQEIRANEVSWNRDFASRDVEKIVSHYADDAIMMAPGLPAFHGKEAIRSFLKTMVADEALSLQFHTGRVQLANSGDVGWSEGSYTMTMTDPETRKPVSSTGSYVTVYRKERGMWKAVSDIASAGPEPGRSQTKEKDHER